MLIDNSGEITIRTYCHNCGSILLFHSFDEQHSNKRLSDKEVYYKRFINCPNCHTEIILGEGTIKFEAKKVHMV